MKKKIIIVPHKTSDFTCPVNGLCDIYEWKNGTRIDENLLLGMQIGFAFISNKNSIPPKMIFMGNGIGKKLIDFWMPLMKYEVSSKKTEVLNTRLSRQKN